MLPDVLDNDPRSLLQAAGLRITLPRLTVLEVLSCRPHSTADTVLHAAREAQASISVQTVYDVLAACTQAGLVRRIQPAGSPALFETRTDDNHHHLACRACGEVVDVDCAVGRAPCLTPSETAGFALDEAEVVFWGLCPACQVVPAP
ncbi:MAG: transcriptional repressor [Actinomycetota bacterium]|nr:transcriptional repressor [Actinomycetota bacterium]